MRRAGLDYHERTKLTVHPSLVDARSALPGRWLAFSSHAARRFTEVEYSDDDVLVFGCEGSGLPKEVVETFAPERLLKIPLKPGNRSLNLANAAAIVIYEAWRQAGFTGASDS